MFIHVHNGNVHTNIRRYIFFVCRIYLSLFCTVLFLQYYVQFSSSYMCVFFNILFCTFKNVFYNLNNIFRCVCFLYLF